jgi:hypothetical protein
MLIASISHHRDGASLHVAEAPLWALLAEEVASWLCAHLRHALCSCPWPLGFRLGQWLLGPASRRERTRWATPLTPEQVRAHFPELALDPDDLG